MDENGVYAGRVCVREDALVRVVASNAYETTEKAFSLAASVKPPPQPEPGEPEPQPVAPEPSVPAQPARAVTLEETLGTLAAAAVMVALVAGIGIVFLGRHNPQAAGGMLKAAGQMQELFMRSIARPILEYLRSVFKKKEPPQQTFGQQQKGQ
ncbi:MAG: hypothetical protein WC717_01020 [Candidatus Micrarchaeia archaeon]